MEDLREDLLDTLAIIKQFLIMNNLGWIARVLSILTLPFFYFILSFGFIKLFISLTFTLYITNFLHKFLKRLE